VRQRCVAAPGAGGRQGFRVSARTAEGNDAVRRGRLAKAEQFASTAEAVLELADELDDITDAYTSLCVLAGIAAADAICCIRLGRYSRGEDHRAAVSLLKTADADAARHLSRLLRFKTAAGYSHVPVSAERARAAGRAMQSLLRAATTA